MDILPDINVNPNYGMKQQAEFRVQRVSFGDGYEQRRVDGLNATRRSWGLTWSNLSREQRDELYEFLMSRQGVYAFLWPVPDGDETRQVLCESVAWQVDDYNVYTVTADFKEDFTL